MPNQRNSNQRRPSQGAARQSQSRSRPRQGQPRRRQRRAPALDLRWLEKLRRKPDFKPDVEESGILKMLHLTQVQRDLYLKWGLYIAIVVLLLMIQDVIMSQVSIFGATTDLCVCVILLITVIEGIDVGSIFVLVASCFYYFSGSSPGPYCVGLLTVLGIGTCLFRQLYWHRNQASIVLCASLALMLYEISVFGMGVFMELTRWDRFGVFLTTGALSILVMIPLYSLINKIGQIGGNTWKE